MAERPWKVESPLSHVQTCGSFVSSGGLAGRKTAVVLTLAPTRPHDLAWLGLVDFAMFPHLDHEDLPENTMADAERWPRDAGAGYAIDDETAIRVANGSVEVVSEGHWKLFTR